MSKFIELDRASMIVRVVAALTKHIKAQPDFTSDELIHVQADAEKITSAAIKKFMQEMDAPTNWIGTVQATIEKREELAIWRARDEAAKTYFKTDEPCILPELLGVAMGFYFEPTAKSIQKLEQAGIALYGSRWQTELAASLKNADGKPLDARRIRQWLVGDYATPEWVWPQIKQLAEHRKQQIDELITKL